MKFSKNVNNKKCAPKIIFFNEKKIFIEEYDFRGTLFVIELF